MKARGPLKLERRERSGEWIAASDSASAPERGGCVRVADGHYRFAGASLNCVFGTHDSAVRAVPAMKDGSPYGLKVRGVTPGSWHASCGFQDNDVILSVEGHKLSSPESMLEAYSALKKEGKKTWVLERSARKVTLIIEPQQ